MIILSKLNFSFVHIPKCGGSTIQRWIRPHLPVEGDFTGKIEHPDIGTVYKDHLTLAQIRDHYPSILQKLHAHDTYAIIRDLIARFESALGQYTSEMCGNNITLMTPDEIRAMAQDILTQIRDMGTGFRFELTHFQPQAAFVELDGKRIANQLRPLNAMDDTFAEMAARLDIPPPQVTRQNARKEFRIEALGPTLRFLDRLAHTVLPPAFAVGLNRTAGIVFQKPKSTKRRCPFDDAIVRDIRAFYHRDFELFEEVSTSREVM